MRSIRWKALTIASLAVCCGSALGQAPADAFPSRPVVLISGFAAGGPGDSEVRFYTSKMAALMGQSFVIDFKPGAGGMIGASYVAKSRADGHTLLITTGGFTVYPAVYPDLPYDTVRDFAPVTLMSGRKSVLVANPSFPARTIADYMAYAKLNPGKISYGTTGSGGIGHLAGTWLHSTTGTKVTFVHYKGAPSQLLDLVAGRVDVASGNLLAQLPLIKAGKIRPLGILTPERSKFLPGITSVSEVNPEFRFTSYLGIVAPAATPLAIVNRLNDALVRVTKDPEVIAGLDAEDIVLIGSTTAQFRQHIVSEVALWKRIVSENAIRLEE